MPAPSASSRPADAATAAQWKKLLTPAKVPKKWRILLRQLPGYDPFRDSAGCRFDPDEAQRAIDFFPEFLQHIEGQLDGKPFELEPHQQAIVANLFGWKRIDSYGRIVRRYRKALIYEPRKNGKTPLAAGIGLYVLFCDDEVGQQDYIAAADKEQAGHLFRFAKGMVERDEDLRARSKCYGGHAEAGQSRSIVRQETGSFLRVISADAHTKHGGNTHLALVDELHAQPDRELVDVLITSTASKNRKQPLIVFITTADFNRPSICNEEYDYASKVRDGIIRDATYLPAIYEALPTDRWDDEKTWKRCNPNLGVSVSIDYLRQQCAKAKEQPTFENTFKRLNLNIRTEQDVRAIPMDRWDACGLAKRADPIKWRTQALERLRGQTCLGGIDLGSVSDLSSLGLLFAASEAWEPPYTILPFYWVPRQNAELRERRDRVPYLTWIRQGFIAATEGDTTDYDVVRRDLNALADAYAIQELAVDRLFQGAQLCTQLAGDGFEVVAFGQGFLSMAAPVKRFLELVKNGELQHGNNPVLRWNASNAATEEDAAGNLKWSKKKSPEKIDGVVAATMALGRLMLQSEQGSVYDDPATPVC